MSKSSFFSVSCGATVFMALYISMAAFNLYRLMFPLAMVDVASFPESSLVKPLWSKASEMHLRVYLSSRKRFSRAFFEESSNDVILLWDEKLDSPAFSKSFLLTTTTTDCNKDASCSAAVSWLDHAEHVAAESSEGGILSAMSAAGHGIESTSFLLTLYNSMAEQIRKLLVFLSVLPEPVLDDETKTGILDRKVVNLHPESSRIWSTLQSNSTIYVHALLIRTDQGLLWPPSSSEEAFAAFNKAYKSHALLMGQVDMVKYDPPHHIGKPRRILWHDLLYFWKRYVQNSSEPPPWDMSYAKPKEFQNYKAMLKLKEKGSGYPYWKPEVAIKLVNEEDEYPEPLAGLSGMHAVRVPRTASHPTGIAFTPAMHVDEIGLTSEKYLAINATVTSLPLRISFDRSDIDHKAKWTTATAGGMSPARWRLLTQLSDGLEAQKRLGFEQSDIDDVRRLIADTNVTLLGITMLFSALHMLFEFLTFKSEVSFWRNNKDLTGLSVRSLFLDMIGQIVILLFLIEKDSSLLMTIPSGIGCLIALWKCQRAAGLKFVKLTDRKSAVSWWNWIPSLFGYELRATRLEVRPGQSSTTKTDLARVTLEADRIATRTLGSVLLPLVVGYTLYSLVREEHTGWYSWLVTSASSAVYALGFVLMTPQLFLNWKLKSVAHLPWRVLVYKSLNTFIDDLFSFIIRMPTMARISCFRDDVVFFIYLYQRWLYPVDTSRPVEGGGEAESKPSPSASEKKKKQ